MKFDGWRVQVRRQGREIALLSRRGLDLTNRFSRVAEAVESLPAANFIIDGELVALDAAGLPSFDDLARRDCDASLCAFDILFGDGRDLRGQPLFERRRRLGTLLNRPPSCIVMPGAFAEGRELLAAVEIMGLEGIVSKRLDMPYRSGANCGWVKVKTKAWQAIGQERHRRFGMRR